MAGLGKLPIESHKLQAFVSEPLKPLLDQVVSFGGAGGIFYISQSDKGGMVFGGDLDWYKSYAQRGNLPTVQNVAECGDVDPPLSRARPPAAPLVGRDGHVHGRLALHLQNAARQLLSERRLELWGLQGEPRIRLVLCRFDRQ